MDNKDFTASILIDQTPKEVFDAINDVRAWWTGSIVGKTDKVGEVWIYCYPNIHFCKMRVKELNPGKRVVWHVMDSYIDVDGDKEEWTGTDIVFDISKEGSKTKLTFTHIGLVPKFVCYNGCKEGWTFYINNSLQDLITTGQGAPNKDVKAP
ncbi:MAG: SRPBCC family protein [Candidatus Saccharimonadales bacterium]